MSTYADRRDTRRIIVGPEFSISFLLKGHAYQDVRITNLSPGGCFALVGARDARLFERGAVLEDGGDEFVHEMAGRSAVRGSAYFFPKKPRMAVATSSRMASVISG